MLSRTATGFCLDDNGVLWGVEAASSLRGLSVRRVGRWERASGQAGEDRGAGWKALLAEALAEGFGSAGAVTVGVPAHSTFQKRLSFPFRGRARLGQVVRPSLEGEIPIPVSDIEVDFLVLPSPRGEAAPSLGRRAGAEVMAVALPRPLADAVRGSFPSGGPGARSPVLQTDALGLAAAARELGVTDGVAAWVGGKTASLVRLEHGQVADLRRLRAFRPEELSGLVTGAVSGWGAEGPVLLAGASWDRLPVRSALRDAGVEAVLEGEDTSLLREAGVEDPGPWLPALGLALAGLGREAAPFDLLRPAQAASRGWGWTAPRTRLAALAGTALLLALAAFVSDTMAARREYDHQAALLRAAFASLFPGVKAVNETAQLRERIAALSRRVEDLSAGMGQGADPLEAMGELSRLAPPELDLKLEELSVEPGRLRVDASLPGFDAIDQLKAAMESSPIFSGVKVQNARVGANAGRVSFRLQAEVK